MRVVEEADVIQPYRHVWNVTLARWIDELAAIIFDRSGTVAKGLSWFILDQETRFRAETMEGDRVRAVVTLPAIERVTARLDVRLVREQDEVTLVECRSTWILVSLADRRPRRIDDGMRARIAQ
jgi:acyl-CoA thioesterase FadM